MIENFIKNNNYEYYKDISLKKYNTYKLEALCKFLIYPNTVSQLLDLLDYLRKNNINYLILGNGSNVILDREVFEVIIKLDHFNKIDINNNIVVAEAGVSLSYLSHICMQNNLSGLSFAGGIPGLVGAATVTNAGAYQEDMANIVKEVKVITPNLQIKTMNKDDLAFSYRNSFLKHHKDYVCLETTFELALGESIKIKDVMDDRKRRRTLSQPLDLPSAGSVFRNPEGLFAGKLIEDLGLKGYRIGSAQISEKHANFIVNTGEATSRDILDLIGFIKSEVKKKYNIDLTLEQEIIR